MMGGKERLEKIQERLKAKGVKDVRFTLGPKAETASLEELKNAAATILEAIEDGKTTLKKSFDGRKTL